MPRARNSIPDKLRLSLDLLLIEILCAGELREEFFGDLLLQAWQCAQSERQRRGLLVASATVSLRGAEYRGDQTLICQSI